MHDPALIVLDEPTGGLDPNSRDVPGLLEEVRTREETPTDNPYRVWCPG